MCGIAGIINFDGARASIQSIQRMTDKLCHRGPDDEGFHVDRTVALGHKRLSIIDLTSAGRQPMSNEDGSIWLVFNGEIYNFMELAVDLRNRGHIFLSKTDGEVIVHAFEEWGEDCLSRFNGMWAFAIWDSKQKIMFCARDRFGIKPFYYYHDKNCFVFASEIPAILSDEAIPCQPNESIIFDYLAYPCNDYIDHSEGSFFRGIKRLMPAHSMVIKPGGDVVTRRYWDLDPERRFDHITDEEAGQRFYDLFEDSIRLRLQSEVPIGTCLSGGLDSSSIVSVVNKLILDEGCNTEAIGERQKTFSACFEDKACDEKEYIKAVIQKSRAEAHFTFPDGKDLFDSAQKFVCDQGEPVAGTSQWAGWLVMRLAREQGIKVVLNGQGADEILAGYGSYFRANFKDLFKALKFRQLTNEINKYSRYHGYPRQWLVRELATHFIPFHPLRWKRRLLGTKEPNPFPSWLNRDFARTFQHNIVGRVKYNGYMDQGLYHFLTFERLPALLRYEDRNSMAFSIEARLPFLDFRLVEFCFSLPAVQKIRDGAGKIVLRNAMNGILPKVVQERIRKIGFATPENTWFRTVCKSAIEDIIGSKSFMERGYFNASEVSRHFMELLNGEVVDTRSIWKIVNLEIWMRQFFGS